MCIFAAWCGSSERWYLLTVHKYCIAGDLLVCIFAVWFYIKERWGLFNVPKCGMSVYFCTLAAANRA